MGGCHIGLNSGNMGQCVESPNIGISLGVIIARQQLVFVDQALGLSLLCSTACLGPSQNCSFYLNTIRHTDMRARRCPGCKIPNREHHWDLLHSDCKGSPSSEKR